MENFIFQTMLEAYDTVCAFNIDTTEIHFIKNNLLNIAPGTQMMGEEFGSTHHKNEAIHPDDRYLFHINFAPAALNHKAETRDNGLLFAYRQFNGEKYVWYSIYLFIPADFGEGSRNIVICRRRVSEESADQMEMLEKYNNKILTVLKTNLNTRDFQVVKTTEPEQHRARKNRKNPKLYTQQLIEEGVIHKDDINMFKRYTDYATVKTYFDSGLDEVSFFYRRKIGGIYRWVRTMIMKASEYTEERPVFFFIVEDINNVLAKMLGTNGRRGFTGIDSPENNINEVYYENMSNILAYLTQKYVDFYMIDLKKDLYVAYKINPDTVSGDMSFVGSYSQMSKNYVNNRIDKEQAEHLLSFANAEVFRQQLMDKASMEFTFKHANGMNVKTICTKIESERGIPTKVICATIPYEPEGLLQVRTFGNFDVFDEKGERIKFTKKQSKQLLAYLIDKQGYPVTTREIVTDVLEKDLEDKNALKYVSRLSQLAIKDLEEAGYPDIIVKEWNSLRVNVDKVDCDYYHLANGDASYLHLYCNEYMKEYSWAEETNAEILSLFAR